MKAVNKLFPLFLCVSFLASLYFKNPDQTSPLPTKKELILSGLSLIKRITPVNRGNFEILLYQSQNCEGLVALIALEKNAEGAAILAHYLKRPLSDIHFIYKSQIHDQFPAFSYWLGSINPLSAPSHVLAVKEFGLCKLIEKTDWSQI